jgi:hypothetical protein
MNYIGKNLIPLKTKNIFFKEEKILSKLKYDFSIYDKKKELKQDFFGKYLLKIDFLNEKLIEKQIMLINQILNKKEKSIHIVNLFLQFFGKEILKIYNIKKHDYDEFIKKIYKNDLKDKFTKIEKYNKDSDIDFVLTDSSDSSSGSPSPKKKKNLFNIFKKLFNNTNEITGEISDDKDLTNDHDSFVMSNNNLLNINLDTKSNSNIILEKKMIEKKINDKVFNVKNIYLQEVDENMVMKQKVIYENLFKKKKLKLNETIKEVNFILLYFDVEFQELYNKNTKEFEIYLLKVFEGNYGFPDFIISADLLNEKNKLCKKSSKKSVFDQNCKMCDNLFSKFIFGCGCSFCGDCGETIFDINQNCPNCKIKINFEKIQKFSFKEKPSILG